MSQDRPLEKGFSKLLGNNFNILSKETVEGLERGQITEEFLKNCEVSFDKPVYLCGPPPIMEAVEAQL